MQLHIIFLGLSSLFQGHLPLFPIVSQPEKRNTLKFSKISLFLICIFFETIKKYPSMLMCLLFIYLESIFSIWTVRRLPP